MEPRTSKSDLEKSIDRRISRLRSELGNPFLEYPSLAYNAKALEEADKAAADKKLRRPKLEFLSRADAFLTAP